MKIKFKNRQMLGILLMQKYSGKTLEEVTKFRKIYAKKLEEELEKDREFLNKCVEKDKHGNWKRKADNSFIIIPKHKQEFEETTKRRQEEDFIEINDPSTKTIKKVIEDKMKLISTNKEEVTIDEYESLTDLLEMFNK